MKTTRAVQKLVRNPTVKIKLNNASRMADVAQKFVDETTRREKLHGRAFYESLGSPKFVLAPMVDQSEFAWRMLSRSFMTPETSKSLLAYTPMLHARMFAETVKFRDNHFQPIRAAVRGDKFPRTEALSTIYLDGNPAIDRPLFVQFCANNSDELLEAASHVAPYCDAVDLNLGCPQGIARKGHYGAFLQEDQDLVYRLINKLHTNLPVPVTAKIRILESREKTLEYAQKVLSAGASILTVHGRQRDQKGHKTGMADWDVLRFLRESLPKQTVLFANGNILRRGDIDECLRVTGFDAVMSAEGNLYDPAIFAEPPVVGNEGREYWRGVDGKGGFRVDAIFRRYMDIIYKHVLEVPTPERKPLFIAADAQDETTETSAIENPEGANGSNKKRPIEPEAESGPPQKKQKGSKNERTNNPNLVAMQPHLFRLLRPLVKKHHNIRDALARSRAGDVAAFENVLQMTEAVVKEALIEYKATGGKSIEEELQMDNRIGDKHEEASLETTAAYDSSVQTVLDCKRPWWIAQSYVRPLPNEALQKGSLTLSRKELAALPEEDRRKLEGRGANAKLNGRKSTAVPEKSNEPVDTLGRVESVIVEDKGNGNIETVELPRDGLVSG